jgi:hypothetical protein
MLALGVGSSARLARASDSAAAQVLFDQGRTLMAQERWSEACPKLEESQRLDPAGGTILHLALCREHEGRLATAWALYQDALARAKHDARKDRAKIAQERIDALGPTLPRMVVRVAIANRKTEGFTLLRDDLVMGQAQWGEAFPVDPGTRTLIARARGKKTWTARIDVPAKAQEIVVEVPELENEQVADAASLGSPPPSHLEEATRGETQRAAGLVVAGVGVVGAIVGTVFGVISFSKVNEADKECAPPDRTLCTARGLDASDAATSAGNVSTVAFIAGGALIAGGLALYFTAPTGRPVAVTPSATVGGAWLGLSTSF